MNLPNLPGEDGDLFESLAVGAHEVQTAALDGVVPGVSGREVITDEGDPARPGLLLAGEGWLARRGGKRQQHRDQYQSREGL